MTRSRSTLADELAMISTQKKRVLRHVQKSEAWRAIEHHIVSQEERNCLIEFPRLSKLNGNSSGYGVSLREITPYGLVSIEGKMEHAPVFRAEINIAFADEENKDCHWNKDYEIQIPYDLVENFSSQSFDDWILDMRSVLLEKEIEIMQTIFKEKFARCSNLKNWVKQEMSRI